MSTEKTWREDERPIVAARLSCYPYGIDGTFLSTDGWEFERFERNGEMAAVPFLRLKKGPVEIESSLRSFDWVEFAGADE